MFQETQVAVGNTDLHTDSLAPGTVQKQQFEKYLQLFVKESHLLILKSLPERWGTLGTFYWMEPLVSARFAFSLYFIIIGRRVSSCNLQAHAKAWGPALLPI